jgi:hypothetical protein
MIFLAKHSLCDAYACLCTFLKSLFATISCDFRGFSLFPLVFLHSDFDYEKYDLSHIQNAIIEKNEKGKLKIEPIKEEEIEQAIKNLKPGKSLASVSPLCSGFCI